MEFSKTPLPLIEGKFPPVSMWMNGEFVYYYPEPDEDYQDPEIREEEKYRVNDKEEFYNYTTTCLKCGTEFIAYGDKDTLIRNFCPGCGERLVTS